jgi:hypothetical protein
MSYSIAEITCHLLASRHELSCSWRLWRRLVTGLRARGRGVGESGAFLLGTKCTSGRRRIVNFLL